MVLVKTVEANSYAAKAGILPGDILLSIDNNVINDVLDYRFYLTNRSIILKIHRGPELLDFKIKKEEYDDIGLGFDTYLMDTQKHCKNKCVFCFIDQLPPGMRDSLYFKDDDSRMSFLMGNYITLTNMTDEDIDRIIKMHMEPINISVHTTNPKLRVQMMKNPQAANIMATMKRLAANGISMNAQLVLCKGYNDKEELQRSLDDLMTLYPALSSVSIVPAGLTKYREKLPIIAPFTKEDCTEIIASVDRAREICEKTFGCPLFCCSDEWYLKAQLPLPQESYYFGYSQLENGVGMITSMQTEFDDALEELRQMPLNEKRHISVATGEAAYPFILSLTKKLQEIYPKLDCTVYKIKNHFFGENITVAGLLCGVDIIAQLKDQALGSILYLPSVVLRHEKDMLLDNTTPADLEKALHVPVRFLDNDGYDFAYTLCGREEDTVYS